VTIIERPALSQIRKRVRALGLVSMLMVISSEMIHALLPLFFVTVLGTSMVTVGIMKESRKPRRRAACVRRRSSDWRKNDQGRG
jgi:hypothetical protein